MTIIATQLASNHTGVTLSEPVTFFTDLLITLACCVFWILMRKNIVNPYSKRYWLWFFPTLGASTLLGGLGHLLYMYAGTNLLLCSWLLSGLAIFFFEMDSISLVSSCRLRISLGASLIMKLIAFWIFTLVYGNFIAVKIHAALGLLFIVFVIHLVNFLRSHALGSVFIIIGIVLATSSALIHSMRFTVSERWFNHNDLSHVVVLASLLAIYQGAVRLSAAFAVKSSEAGASQ
jgi:hypothetical protein